MDNNLLRKGARSRLVFTRALFYITLLVVVVTVLAIILIWVLGNIFWVLILIFMAMLYWIFFRALRLIFKKHRYAEAAYGRV